MIDREAFLLERSTGIGGSDVASVFGIGYGCRLRLWRDKRGEVPDYPFEVTGPIKLGNWLEPHIAEEYAQQTGRIVTEEGLHRHPVHECLIVHIDRGIQSEHRPDPGVLEIKAIGRSVFHKVKREGMPEDYLLQLQHGMLVTGRKWGAFAVMNRDSGELLHWDVDRDVEICSQIIEECPVFWAQVENGPAPDMLEPDDKRCHSCGYRRSCQGAALMDIAAKDDGGVTTDDSLAPLLAEYDERKALADEAAEALEETKEQLKTALGTRCAVRCTGRPIYYRVQTSMRWDSKALDKDHPELAAKYKKASESRPLRIF